MLSRLMRTDRQNFILGVTHETLWGFGFGLIHPYTILPLAWLDLGGSPRWAGVLPGLLYFGMNAPQVFAAYLFPPRYTEPKRTALLNGIALAGPLVMAMAFLLPGAASLRQGLFLAGSFLFFLGMGLVVPHWMSAMARSIPAPVRGRFFGTCFFFSNGVGMLAGFVASAWAVKGGLSWGYLLVSATTLPFLLASLGVMARMRPLSGPPHPSREKRLWDYLAARAREWSAHRPLKAVAFITVVGMMAGTIGNFLTVYVRDELATDKRWFILFTPAMSAGAMAGTFALGRWCDLRGPRFAIQTAFGAIAVCLLGATLLPAGPWHALSFFAGGFGGSVFVVMMVIVLRAAGEKRNTFLAGFLNSAMAPFSFGVPFLWSWAIARWGYGAGFAASGFFCVAGMVWTARDRTFDRVFRRGR